MYIQKKGSTRRIRAAEDVDVTPEASELLFQAEDVAQLVAEVTDEDVAVDTDDTTDAVVFTVGDDEYTVEPEGDEEILEASTRPSVRKRTVSASTRTGRYNRSTKSRVIKRSVR